MLIIFLILVGLLLFLWLAVKLHLFESPQRRFGRMGEKIAAREIRSLLKKDDILLNNVKILFDSRPAELDNVVINANGVFIIEVKRYVGILSGGEEDYEWQKYKVTNAGNVYDKAVKNPIRQVKRQVHLLAKYLQSKGIRVWVEGRVLLLDNESPVKSEFVAASAADLSRLLHTPGRTRLSAASINRIRAALK